MTDIAGPPPPPPADRPVPPSGAPWAGGPGPAQGYPTRVHPAPASPARGSGSRTGAHVVGAVLGLVVTPLALVLLGASGQSRHIETMQRMSAGGPLPVLGVLAGVLLLAAVACAAAWSWVGPVVGGTLYGVLPGLAWLIAPAPLARATFTLVDVRAAQWLSTLGSNGTLLALGLLLVAAGVAGALAHRRAPARG